MNAARWPGVTRYRVLSWHLAHYAPRLCISVAATGVVDFVVDNALTGMLSILSVLIAGAAVAAGGIHGQGPCLICAELTPLNPQSAAEQQQGKLMAYHRYALPVLLLGIAVVILGAIFLEKGSLSGMANSVALWLAMGWTTALSRTHGLLAPWCLTCHPPGGGGGGGGDFDDLPEPTPPGVSATA